MLQDREPFTIILRTLQIFGLWKHSELSRRHQFLAIIAYILFLAFSLLVLLAYKQIEDANGLSQYLAVAPGFVFLNAIMVNFFQKRKQIGKLIDDIGHVADNEPLSYNYIEASLRISRILTYSAVFMSVGCALLAFLIPVLAKKLVITIWLPFSSLNEGYGFYFLWIIQTIAYLYGGPLFIMIQEVLLTLLIVIRGYQKYLHDELRGISLNFEGGHLQIQKCVQSHLNLKR